MNEFVEGFSKKNKQQRIEWLCQTYFPEDQQAEYRFKRYENTDSALQKLHDEFIENTVANYYLPLAVAPNFLINGRQYTVPMVTEESSVVAAVSKAAKFWSGRGGFHTEVISTEKVGQVHFLYEGDVSELMLFFEKIKPTLWSETDALTQNMRQRGGGILQMELRNKTEEMPHYYQIHCTFETLDAMGANFINSCLERIAAVFREEFHKEGLAGKLEIVMSILSNYVPQCCVKAWVSCSTEVLATKEMSGDQFAEKLVQAVRMAEVEVHRAVTHNKGIMNGVDAVILATGNDFRAVEAGVHAYACRSGRYRSLTTASIKDGQLEFSIEIPLAVGTIGGLTRLHPMVRAALQILKNPSAKELMQIVAAVGLAQNFAAVSSLITSGIQKGHMKMHLMNILNQHRATDKEKGEILRYFEHKTVTHNEVVEQLKILRGESITKDDASLNG